MVSHSYFLDHPGSETEGERRPKKVLMTADTVGGVWTYALELTRALGEYDINFALATMGAPLTGEQREEVEQLANVEVVESDFKLEWMENPWQDVSQAGQWLLQLEEQIQPDLVHLNGYAHGALPWQSPTLVVGHSCVLSWWEAVKGESAPPSWNRYRREVARGVRAADLVIAPTQAMLSALRGHYGPIACGIVVPNGRDPLLVTPGLKENFVLTVGRLWDEAKNVAALNRIAPQISWPVFVAGDEKHPHGRTAEIRSTYFLGRLSWAALTSWFARASIYALPARYEPFGLAALEAGLAGCALVLGDIPSLREVWEEAAVFVPPNDSGAIESAIEELIADGARRETLAARARRRALEFTPRRMALGYRLAYSELMMKKFETPQETAACAL
jgi:glycosyltransferase involved in cell wall biosynthesis